MCITGCRGLAPLWQYSRVERPMTRPLGRTTGNHSPPFGLEAVDPAVGAGTTGAMSYGYISSTISSENYFDTEGRGITDTSLNEYMKTVFLLHDSPVDIHNIPCLCLMIEIYRKFLNRTR